jgi:hypothetical protein
LAEDEVGGSEKLHLSEMASFETDLTNFAAVLLTPAGDTVRSIFSTS